MNKRKFSALLRPKSVILESNLTLKYTKEPLDYPYRPSVDTFFNSVAQHWPGKGVAVLLTGMGKDGAKGLKALRSIGWHTIAQDRETCVVYGMPKAAAELNAAVQILPSSDRLSLQPIFILSIKYRWAIWLKAFGIMADDAREFGGS
ncbi:MAG: hypothetical protein HC894_30050 [Microcoleus sp. SM1_3_4]|nr:hypothetical protein [Microcoleus sp. SM1_3_4]